MELLRSLSEAQKGAGAMCARCLARFSGPSFIKYSFSCLMWFWHRRTVRAAHKVKLLFGERQKG